MNLTTAPPSSALPYANHPLARSLAIALAMPVAAPALWAAEPVNQLTEVEAGDPAEVWSLSNNSDLRVERGHILEIQALDSAVAPQNAEMKYAGSSFVNAITGRNASIDITNSVIRSEIGASDGGRLTLTDSNVYVSPDCLPAQSNASCGGT